MKKEKDLHEKKLGILKYFGETEDGMANNRPWWSDVPKRLSKTQTEAALSEYVFNLL